MVCNACNSEIYSLTPIKSTGPKQILERLPMALAKVKTCNTSEKLVNEIQQISNKSNYEQRME